MITLTKENIICYLQENLKSKCFEEPILIQAIGDGSNSAEDDGDGYVNFVFRVKTEEFSLIVKQARPELRQRSEHTLPVRRNKMETDIWKLRAAITPEYIPKIYFVDLQNNIFVTEDVSYLKIMRFQLNQSRQFPNFAKLCARYIAASHFYTSEYYLSTEDFRNLCVHFMNEDMKPVMEDGIFLNFFGTNMIDPTIGKFFHEYATRMYKDNDLTTNRYRLRQIFMTRSEALIHADLHTSNIFIGEDTLKVIDMEFVCGGPLAYDLGAVIGNLLSQFSSASFRHYDSDSERISFQAYLLSSIKSLYEYYIQYFFEFWRENAKELYQNIAGIEKDFSLTILREMFGFAAAINWARSAGPAAYPDFDILDKTSKEYALILNLMILEYLLRNWSTLSSIDEAIDAILDLSEDFIKKIKN